MKMSDDSTYPIEEFTEIATRNFDFELINTREISPQPPRSTITYEVEFLARNEEFFEIEQTFYKLVDPELSLPKGFGVFKPTREPEYYEEEDEEEDEEEEASEEDK